MKGKFTILRAFILAVFVLYVTGCSLFTRQFDFESRCKERGVEFNIWKEFRIGLESSGYDPADFDLKVSKCKDMGSGAKCYCDVSVSGYVCDHTDLQEVLKIAQTIKGIELGQIDDEDLEVVEPANLKFLQSNQFIFFLNRNRELYPGDSLNAGYVQTPMGRFEALVKGEQKGISPGLRFEGVDLNLIEISQPKKLCYKYFAPLPLTKLSGFPGTCGIVIEDYLYGDNVYLVCGGRWYLAGSWKDRPQQKEQLPSHLSGYSIQRNY